MERKKILEMNAFDINGPVPLDNPLLARRLKNLGASSVLFYRDPIEMVSAKGAWMFAADGSKYLDFYNNVPSVGHCHEEVVAAISRQAGLLNIHTRYLSRVVDDYIEDLKSTLPASLSNVLMCCTGSEANDLALRLAYKKTSKTGVIVTEGAYHGNTLAVTEISPSALKDTPLPDHVVTVPPPSSGCYGEDIAKGFADAIEAAAGVLEQRGYGFAALICDSIFSSDGVFSDPAGFLKVAADRVHELGGVYIADEVQPGFGRTGDHMWGFGRHGVLPDLVTMGKPMGNGFPMAAVAAGSADVKHFCDEVGYFNTFGGNPVAAAAGQAVLNIIREEKLMDNAKKVGGHILRGLRDIQDRYTAVTDVRGTGFFIGIDMCEQGDPSKPDPLMTTNVTNALKSRKVLIGAAGKYGNTLKLRPPLVLSQKEADIFLNALEDSLKMLEG